MISFASSSVSAIRAGFLRTDVSVHDVANINTPGFAQNRVLQTEQNPGTAIAAIQKILSPSRDFSATDFAEEAGELIKAKAEVALNSKTLKMQNSMIGELLDMKA